MDLASIQPTAIEVAVLHPATGEPTGLVLTCISPQDAQAAVARRTLLDKQRRKGVSERDTIEFLAALVRDWTWGGDAQWKGEKLPFTPANVRTVLSEPWVRMQVDEALGDNSGFFPT